MAWCHALGRWFDHKAVKAAQLATKSLDGLDLSYLFRVEEAVLVSPAKRYNNKTFLLTVFFGGGLSKSNSHLS